MGVVNDFELYTLKWNILCYMSFNSIKCKLQCENKIPFSTSLVIKSQHAPIKMNFFTESFCVDYNSLNLHNQLLHSVPSSLR